MTDKLHDDLTRNLNALRAAASRGPVTSREIFQITDGMMDLLSRAALAATPQPAMREETDLEHMARDMREGRFPGRSPRQQVHVEDALLAAGYRKADALLAERDALIHDIERAKASEMSLLSELGDARAETLEQARLNGMGGERELALMARAEQAERERDAARAEGYRQGQENMRSRIASPLFLRPLVDEQSAGEWYEETLAADTQMYADAILAVPLAPEGSS